MAKTFKEVAHHYIGCECETPTGKAKLTTISLLGKPKFLKGGASVTVGYEWSEVKPLLRDMESMNDKEASEIWDSCMPKTGYRHNNRMRVLYNMHTAENAAPLINALCRHSFNVFNLPSTEYKKITDQ